MFNHLSPYVRVAMDHWLQPGAFIEDRAIWDYEILYLKQGNLEIRIDGTIYRGIPGDVFIIRPGQNHSIRVIGDQPVEQPHVHFDLIEQPDSPSVTVSFKPLSRMTPKEKSLFRQDLLGTPPHVLPNLIRLHDTVSFDLKLFDIIQEFQMRNDYFELRLKGLILELLSLLFREATWSNQNDEPEKMKMLNQIKNYLNTNANRDLRLDEMSSQFHLNKHYLIGAFKEAYGITPIQYHQQMRMERAKNMLVYTLFSVQEISDSLGYLGIHAFSRAFKNKEGISPTVYRELHMKK